MIFESGRFREVAKRGSSRRAASPIFSRLAFLLLIACELSVDLTSSQTEVIRFGRSIETEDLLLVSLLPSFLPFTLTPFSSRSFPNQLLVSLNAMKPTSDPQSASKNPARRVVKSACPSLPKAETVHGSIGPSQGPSSDSGGRIMEEYMARYRKYASDSCKCFKRS